MTEQPPAPSRRSPPLHVLLVLAAVVVYLLGQRGSFTNYAADQEQAYLGGHWSFWVALALLVAAAVLSRRYRRRS